MGELPRLKDFADASFDPFMADELVYGINPDPHTVLAELRRVSPVAEANYYELIGEGYQTQKREGAREFLVLGHKEVSEALLDVRTFSNIAYDNSLGLTFGESLSVMDPPEHPRYRRIFQAAFLPSTINAWGAEIVEPVIAELLDPLLPHGKADLVDDFTRLYPFHIIYRQLGLPNDQAKVFHRLSMAQTLIGYGNFVDQAKEAARNLGDFFRAMMEMRRRDPGTDLVSMLVQAEAGGEKLPDEVIVSFLRQLMNAAGDTTFRGTSVLLKGLLDNPDQLEAVRADRSLIPQAVEEALRWETPVNYSPREATRDTVLGGVAIPKGSRVEIFNAAANRDESVYPDPERFNILRPKKRNMGFGGGPHICIGQHLARLEMARALDAVLDRMPNLRLDPDSPKPVIRGSMLRYPKHLNVLFG